MSINCSQIHKCAYSFSLPQYPSFPHHTWRHCEQWSSPWERMMVLQQFFKNIGVTAIFLKMKFKCFKNTLPFCLLWTFPLRNPLRRESAVSRSSVGLLQGVFRLPILHFHFHFHYHFWLLTSMSRGSGSGSESWREHGSRSGSWKKKLLQEVVEEVGRSHFHITS